MKKNSICLTAILSLLFGVTANAGLVAVWVIAGPDQHPDADIWNTWQVIASFSDAGDKISAVNGVANANSLDFWTCNGSDIYNQPQLDGLPSNDFPSSGGLGGEPWDSYVTIGETSFPANTQFTPDFLGDWGGVPPTVQVIEGDEFHEDDGAWFFFGSPPQVGDLPDAVDGNGTSDVVIAQFTVREGIGFHFNGNIAWINALAGSNNTPFDIHPANCVPSPGVIALFSMAYISGVRRRRCK